MTTSKKITKRTFFTLLDNLTTYAETSGAALADDITYEDVHEFINREIALLDNKAAAAQKRAAVKRETGDALREEVYEVLSADSFMTIDEVVDALGNPDVTRNMVTSRLSQLAHDDRAVKDTVTVGGEGKTRKITAYKRA